ncbi:lytic polysaccharide monooxygenase [Bipolaris victoriae FI3]|uniref:AA9 family lytic polysaccharide monooxygenase n=1 Tax=Bipolaris victoriae (strain FI3) TaxID=930091 RepID=W7EXG9_BIPV3|nr:lytic polysaccharide monooxygenase [Bipolaris victoriae FI3]
MKTQSILLAALASAPAALAHTVFTDFYVDGVPQGDGVAIRMNPSGEHTSSPIGSLDSTDMACNVQGTKGVSRTQTVQDGSVLTFEIREWPDDPSKERLDPGHKGPCAVYLKKVEDATTDTAAGDGWFKIFDHGYDADSKQWCTDKIIANNGLLSVTLPENLLQGDYLARPEILALHAAKDGDPQFYTGCAQIFLKSSGNLVPESTVSIPGYVKYNEPSTDFDIYNTPATEYVVPGPKVAKLTAGASKSSATVQTKGLKPQGCVMENANWCAKEVQSYTDEKGCWAAAEDCWAQSDVCYDSAPPTGGKNCKLWQDKCTDIGAQCKAGNWVGPPNKGKDLTPAKKSIDVGLIMPNQVQPGAPSKNTPAPSSEKEQEEPESTPAPKPETETKPEDSEYQPAPAPAKPVVEAPKPTPTPDAPAAPSNDEYDSPPFMEPTNYPAAPPPAPSKQPTTLSKAPISTITVAPSSAGGPKPTQPPCPKGYRCVYVTDLVVVTTTVYVTEGAAPTATPAPSSGSYMKRAHLHPRRRLHMA